MLSSYSLVHADLHAKHTGDHLPMAIPLDGPIQQVKSFPFQLAEGVGFEPTFAQKDENGFQDRHHKPLGHPS
jgi:hypothetical protein